MKVIKLIAALKARVNHTMGYFNIIGVPLLVANLFQEKLALMGVEISFITLIIIGIVFVLIIGTIFDKIGLMRAEIEYMSQRNNKLLSIEKKLNEMAKK